MPWNVPDLENVFLSPMSFCQLCFYPPLFLSGRLSWICKGLSSTDYLDLKLINPKSQLSCNSREAIPRAKVWPKVYFSSVQFSHSVMSDSATPWIIARQASLSITNSRSSLRLTSIESVMPSSHPAISSSVVPFSSCPQSLQHQSLFQWVNSSHEVAKVLEFQL